MNNLFQPHDKFIKALLALPESAEIFLQERLPQEVVALLRTETVQLVESSFLDENLRARFSDRLFHVMTVNGEQAYIYALLEHKSKYDKWTPLQLLTNLVSLLNGIKQTGVSELPPVITILVYHGVPPWKGLNEFMSLVNAHETLRPYLLNFQFILVDLGPIADEDLSQNARLRAGLLALKYAYRPKEQQKILEKIDLDLVDAGKEFVMQLLRYVIQVYETVNEAAIREIVRKTKPQEETEMMSIFAREMIAKGLQEGEKNGEKKGEKNEAVKILLRQLTRRFGSLSSWVIDKINAADLETLELWSDRILDATTLEDFFGTDQLH